MRAGVRVVTNKGASGPRGTTSVFIDGALVGFVSHSDKRWVGGWRVDTIDDKYLGEQRSRTDAVEALVQFVTSPFRA